MNCNSDSPEGQDSSDKAKPCYSIDFEWCRRNDRSFTTMALSRLCPTCRWRRKEQAGGEQAVEAEAELVALIRDCCSKAEGFINPKQPIRESVFRIFLSNGNQPLGLEELAAELEKAWGKGMALDILQRIIDHDCYYGLRRVPEA